VGVTVGDAVGDGVTAGSGLAAYLRQSLRSKTAMAVQLKQATIFKSDTIDLLPVSIDLHFTASD